ATESHAGRRGADCSWRGLTRADRLTRGRVRAHWLRAPLGYSDRRCDESDTDDDSAMRFHRGLPFRSGITRDLTASRCPRPVLRVGRGRPGHDGLAASVVVHDHEIAACLLRRAPAIGCRFDIWPSREPVVWLSVWQRIPQVGLQRVVADVEDAASGALVSATSLEHEARVAAR